MESINFFLQRSCYSPKFRVVHINRCYIYIKESYCEAKRQISASMCLLYLLKAMYVRFLRRSMSVSVSSNVPLNVM